MATSQNSPVTWAEQSTLSRVERDCVTAIALKILDKKCKMPVDQQETMLAVYAVLQQQKDTLFDPEVYACIEEALRLEPLSQAIMEQIHQFRLEAEKKIPKPAMKAFKAKLRAELFDPTSKIRPD